MRQFAIAIKAGIIKDGRLLVIHKTRHEAESDPDPEHRADLPGGRLEFGETPIEALKREIAEEVGLEVAIIQPAAVWSWTKGDLQLVGIIYYCRWVSGQVKLSEEHERFEWVTEKELAASAWADKDDYLAVLRLHDVLTSK